MEHVISTGPPFLNLLIMRSAVADEGKSTKISDILVVLKKIKTSKFDFHHFVTVIVLLFRSSILPKVSTTQKKKIKEIV